MKFFLTLSAALLLSFSALAVEIDLATITADIDPQVGHLKLEVVDGKADSLRIISKVDQRITSDDSYPSETLMGRDGLVAIERSGHNVVVIKLEEFDLSKAEQ